MKTFCFSLGLLLLVACCCDAMPDGVQYSVAPGNCCFRFASMAIPRPFVTDIRKTHRSCLKRGFVVKTSKGKQICFSQSNLWAVNVYNRFHSSEGSGL